LDYSESVHDQTGETVNREVPWLKMYAMRQIERFSHPADKDVIDHYVGEHFRPTGTSALDILLAVHLLIL
jgi:hypothetical protein